MLRNCLLLVTTCLVLIVADHVGGAPGKDDEDPTGGAHFVGEKSCRKCHFKRHKRWKAGGVYRHAKAWESLAPHLKTPDQKDGQGRACVSCHVTGFGHADRGGFQDAETSKHLLAVQCEACHGPGSKHIEAGKKVRKDKRRQFNADETKFIRSDVIACANCHSPHKAHDRIGE